MVEQKEFTVTFLVDKEPPDKVVLLRRAADKSFAPGFYTGIGGKVGDSPEFENESALDSAYRELEEETEGELGKGNIELKEFARCVYDSGPVIYYFWGRYAEDKPPRISPSDGTLVWVGTGDLLDRDFIPTTQAVCEEWARRGFRTDSPFTIHVREVGRENTVRLVKVQKVKDGLA